MTDIIIVGGGPAGLTAAIYARRAGRSVLLFEKEGFGGQIVYAQCVENFPGFEKISGTDLADRLSNQALALGTEAMPETVLSVTKDGGTFTVTTDYGTYSARAVIIATGRKNRKLGLAREDELTGKGVSYCALCDGAFYKGLDVAVVGGGSTALQDALYLSDLCRKVYLIHRRDLFRGEAALVELLKKRENVEFVLSSVPTALEGIDEVTGIKVLRRETDEHRTLPVSGVFVAVGQESANEFLSGTVSLDDYGYVRAGEDAKTSCPGLFVAGDCRTKAVRQLTTAVSDGTCAAMAATDYLTALE